MVRLTGLGVHSLWYDEDCSLGVGLADDPIAVLRRDHHPPLFYYLVRGWAALGGEADAWLRLLPALLSCATVLLFARWVGTVSRRLPWAELLQRVFAIDVLECPHCGTRRKLIAMISDGLVLRKILDHLGLPSEPPVLARSRVGEELGFGA